MELDHVTIAAYLEQRFGAPLELIGVVPLAEANTSAAIDSADERLKVHGYGKPLLLRYRLAGVDRQAVLRTMAADPFGHERRCDRAAGMLLCYDSFNELPRHVRVLDVGVISPGEQLRSVGAGEFFLLTDYVPGKLYADDLDRLRAGGDLSELDLERARALAAYLVEIHKTRGDDQQLYVRQLRDVFGSGEGLAGLIDSYPPDYPLANAAWLEGIERRCVAWRHRLKAHPERLSRIHGDFHPYNILFEQGAEFNLLDRSRGPWGEPADDLTALAVNYLFFSLLRSGVLAAPFDALWATFWQTYLDLSGDTEVLRCVQPFFAWRALVVASPLWYRIDDAVRRALFRFIDRVLDEPVFDPARIQMYLEV